MKFSLEGRFAIVCGGSRGIGFASAKFLAEMGATVAILSRNEVSLKKSVSALPTSYGQSHEFIVADHSLPEELVALVVRHIGERKVDILINNTAGPKTGKLLDAKAESFIQTFERHLLANHLLSQWVIAKMKVHNYGRIINIISTSVKEPLENLGVSNTIRGAVASWSKTLASEVASYGITVNNVLPGFTKTERLEEIILHKAGGEASLKDGVVEELTNYVPMKRFAEPEEVAAAVGFLASHEASYITGINLPVDGGRTKSL